MPTESTAGADHQQRYAAWLLLATAAILCVIQIRVLVPNHDTAWLIELSQRMLAGGKYYTDFYEVNPPLYPILLLPVDLLSRVTGIAPYTVLIACVSLLLYYVSLGLFRSLSAITPDLGVGGRILLAGCMQAGLFFLPGYDFGQRDPLAICLILPAVCWLSLEERVPRASLGVAVAAVCATVGVLIKPFLAGVVILCIVGRIVSTGRVRDLLLPVLLPAAVVTAAYAALILRIFPEWLVMAHIAGETYSMYDIHGYLPKWSLISLVLIVALAAANEYLQRSPAARHAVRYFVLAAVGALASYVIQRKGFSYHLVPAKIMLGLLFVILTMTLLQHLRSVIGARPYPYHAAWVGLAALLFFVGEDIRSLSVPRELSDFYVRFASKLTAVQAGERLFFFSTSLPPEFPLNLYYHFTPSSRFPCLWTLPGAITRKGAQAGEILDLVAQDFRRWSPTAFIVDESQHKQAIHGEFEFLPWFRQDPDLRHILDQYELAGRFPGNGQQQAGGAAFAIYVLRGPRTASVPIASLGRN